MDVAELQALSTRERVELLAEQLQAAIDAHREAHDRTVSALELARKANALLLAAWQSEQEAAAAVHATMKGIT